MIYSGRSSDCGGCSRDSVDVVDVEELPLRLVAKGRPINEGVSRAVNGMNMLAPCLLYSIVQYCS